MMVVSNGATVVVAELVKIEVLPPISGDQKPRQPEVIELLHKGK
jgi:hypothetical protein